MKVFSLILIATFNLFSARASIIMNAESAVFPEIEGWEISNKRSFETDNLYYAINGAAELYLKYNFEVMHKAEYTADSNYISVELYRHATNIDAFGVYSIESPVEEERYIEIGVQGHREADHIYFLAGRYYIKIRALYVTPVSEEAIHEIAAGLEADLNEGATFPAIFQSFPETGKVRFSEKYVGENILGYKFLKHSYEANYQLNDNEFTVFVLEGKTQTESQQMLKEYFSYLKLNNEEVTDDSFYSIPDRYNGNVYILSHRNYLICAREGATEAESKEILTAIKSKL